MQKKGNNIRLLVVFVVLLALVLVLFTNKNGHKERSFDKQLVDFETEEVTKVILYPKALSGDKVEVNKDGDSWLIQSENNSYHANISAVDGMISTLKNIEAKSLVATKKDKWGEYEVNDSLATRVQLFKGSKIIADVYIGKFKFSQPRSMSTYVRVEGKKETYKVDGYLTGSFNRTANDLRDKTIIDDPTANWVSLKFDYPADSSFVLSKTENKWMLDGVLADSAQVVNYINSIKTLSGNTIVDENNLDVFNEYKLTVERENLAPIVLNCKRNADELVLQSSENDEAIYSDVSIADKIYVSKSKFEIK